ncbi:glutathione S-transferase [Maricaulis sp.]|uniref:glutathione S-transferase n=1 Tax=Maricaulis sp. TaxID=1486257 RepID=UPI002B272C5A|nr:glutathione S-transferase [Maricaulis sp.]
MNTVRPILYSFRRCPYAMRARLALDVSGIQLEHREILLRDKPQAMLDASPKGTVPVLVLDDGRVIDESLDVMRWALDAHDPETWLAGLDASLDLIATCDGEFKPHLDRYKYATRYDDADPLEHRAAASVFLTRLDARLTRHRGLTEATDRLADFAIYPFVRQFANTDRDWFDRQDWPALKAWLARHLESARFVRVMEKHPLWCGSGECPSERDRPW